MNAFLFSGNGFYKSFFRLTVIVLSIFLFVKCHSFREISVSPFREVPSPSDNPLTPEKIALGRKLFFDKRLSADETVSCSSCHLPEFAFTDRKQVSDGVFGRKTERNSSSLLNAAFLKTVMFDGHLPTLEMQVIVPIQEHVEMGMNMPELIKKLRAIDEYQQAAKQIFSRDFDPYVLTRSISAFERSLVSSNSNFDRFYYGGEQKALTTSAKRGWKIFSEELYCTKCHPAPYFTTFLPENNGFYSMNDADKGRFRIFNDSTDIGKFKVPSLRNIELTYPYMHDGKYMTLDTILQKYAKGGEGHALQNPIIRPFQLTPNQLSDMKAFLFSLTDTSYMENFQ